MTHDEMIAVIQAHEEGKKIQFRNKEYPDSDFCDIQEPTFNFQHSDYRIAPEPKLRPWRPEEVPIGALCRVSWMPRSVQIITSSFNGKIQMPHGSSILSYTPEEVLKYREHSTDHGATWKPCGVEE